MGILKHFEMRKIGLYDTRVDILFCTEIIPTALGGGWRRQSSKKHNKNESNNANWMGGGKKVELKKRVLTKGGGEGGRGLGITVP